MSASDKKKLRKEQAVAALTERQRKEQAEAKKLKIYTISFVAVMVIVICAVIGILGFRAYTNSGIAEKSTVAAVVDGVELNTVEMNYYYNDAINQFYSEMYNQSGDYVDYYMQMMGLNPSTPMTEQTNPETGKPWSDYFLETALNNAKSDYALAKAAAADGFVLPEAERNNLETMIANLDAYAEIYGYSNGDKYLQAIYGNGSNVESYSAYTERNALATAYLTHRHDSLSYSENDYRTYEADAVNNYNSYTYDTVYVSYTDFLAEESEEDTDADTAQKNADAREAARVAAEKLGTCTTLDELKEMVETIEVSEDGDLTVESYENKIHTSINKYVAEWLASADRKEGELGVVENTSTTTDEDGKETTEINGYYVTIFHSKRDNNEPMSNVRHLLVKFEGGTTDESTQETVYSDEEKAAAKEKADGFLKTWKEGAATEESFIELVKENSDDSSAADGGLFENINPNSNYVPNFLNWSIDADRKVGDAEVIETEYGYHVMYYVGKTEMSYRDYMIDTEMRDADHEKWYEEFLEAVKAELKDTSRMRLAIVLSNGY